MSCLKLSRGRELSTSIMKNLNFYNTATSIWVKKKKILSIVQIISTIHSSRIWTSNRNRQLKFNPHARHTSTTRERAIKKDHTRILGKGFYTYKYIYDTPLRNIFRCECRVRKKKRDRWLLFSLSLPRVCAHRFLQSNVCYMREWRKRRDANAFSRWRSWNAHFFYFFFSLSESLFFLFIVVNYQVIIIRIIPRDVRNRFSQIETSIFTVKISLSRVTILFFDFPIQSKYSPIANPLYTGCRKRERDKTWSII